MEALHQAHVLLQVGKHVVSGQNQEKKRAAHSFEHQLLQRQKEDGSLVALSTFLRLEFQDGKRRAVSQSYHGSGRVHIHQLDFVSRRSRVEDLKALQLDKAISASLEHVPPSVQAFAAASQTDDKAKTPWAVERRSNQFDDEQEAYVFFHSEEDHRRGVRGFFPTVMEVTKCHQDVQVEAAGQQNYAAYTAKYAPKFSDAFHDELLNDDTDGNSVAASILSRYHPCIPEMTLQLCGSMFHQWHISTHSRGRRSFVVPLLTAADFPKEVQLYQTCSWRDESMSLLDFLRKSNDAGEVAGWLKEAWQEASTELDLPQFANQYIMEGEKVVACTFNSRLKDRFYGQWLLMNIPFRDPWQLWNEDIVARVPPTDACLALCLTCDHPAAQAMWHDPAAIENDMLVEGRTQLYRKMVLDHVATQQSLIDQYVAGTLPLPPVVESQQQPQVQNVAKEFSLRIQKRYLAQIEAQRKTVEGRLCMGTAAKIGQGDTIYFEHVARTVEAVEHYESFAAMLESVGFENAIPDAADFEEALAVYHSFPNYERLAAEHGVVALWLQEPTALLPEDPQQGTPLWNHEQQFWLARMAADLDRAVVAHSAASEGDLDEAREAAFAQNKFQVLEGPPGTGKTSVAIEAVRRAVQSGVKCLWAVFTAQLAARMKDKLPAEVVVETCHAAFGLDMDLSECGYNLAAYGLVIVDEFSQLQAQHLHHLNTLRANVSNCVAMGLVGDPFQCAGFGSERIWATPLWKSATVQTHLHQVYRCKDPDFQKILSALRTAKPHSTNRGGALTVPRIMAGRRAWRGHWPQESDLARLLRKHPDTTFMAISRRGTAHLATLAMRVLFANAAPIATLKGDVESNPDNYTDDGALKAIRDLEPWSIACFVGMKVFFTKNVDKDRDFVNGMQATIESFNHRSKALIVVTQTGHRVPVRPWTDTQLGNKVYHPFRPGYASTVLKMAGSELAHAVLWLDVPHVPGAAYTGMSRVSFGKDLLIGGNLSPEYFTPARP